MLAQPLTSGDIPYVRGNSSVSMALPIAGQDQRTVQQEQGPATEDISCRINSSGSMALSINGQTDSLHRGDPVSVHPRIAGLVH